VNPLRVRLHHRTLRPIHHTSTIRPDAPPAIEEFARFLAGAPEEEVDEKKRGRSGVRPLPESYPNR
jgi:hypothetical protein